VGTGAVGLALRAGSGLDQPLLAVLPEGSSVHFMSGPISDGTIDWYEIQLTGAGTLSGFGNATYLRPPDPGALAATHEADSGAFQESPSLPHGSRTLTAKVTAYATGGEGGRIGATTASGTRTQWGTVAADVRLFPFGTRLTIQGFEDTVFVVEDTGSAVRGEVFDIWFPDLPSAVTFGTQTRQVTILPPGT
jgi:3D (Asp-Asp-Asp) domain-containing protein